MSAHPKIDFQLLEKAKIIYIATQAEMKAQYDLSSKIFPGIAFGFTKFLSESKYFNIGTYQSAFGPVILQCPKTENDCLDAVRTQKGSLDALINGYLSCMRMQGSKITLWL